jgi:hypothetical protein
MVLFRLRASKGVNVEGIHFCTGVDIVGMASLEEYLTISLNGKML